MGSTKSRPEQSPPRARPAYSASRISALARRFAGCDSGSTAIEYGILLTMVGVALIGVLSFTGGNFNAMFENLGEVIPDIPPAGAAPAVGAEAPV